VASPVPGMCRIILFRKEFLQRYPIDERRGKD
jgi:hypothetical protein